jgi:RNA polymerase sigma-70 factor (ECF subfamily)
LLFLFFKSDKLFLVMDRTDNQLIRDYLQGEEEALQLLIKRYTSIVYNFVAQIVGRGQEAEDITQETFIKVWKNLKKFDINKKFKTWILQIAKNTAIDFLRQKKLPLVNLNPDDEETENFMEQLSDSTPLPFENLVLQEQFAVVQNALQSLPEIYRLVLTMYYTKELTLAEVAEILGEPVETIKSRQRRGLAKLREILV